MFKFLLVFLILSLIVFIEAIYLPIPLSLQNLLISEGQQDSLILYELRLPRIIMCFLVGGVLAISGAIFQTIFRNPLASPYTLGISSGAAFGASLSILLANSFYYPSLINTTVFALISAFLTTAFVIYFAKKTYFVSTTVILCGVIVNLFFSSLLLFIQYLSNYAELIQVTRWLMGSIGLISWNDVTTLFIVSICLLPLIFKKANDLDLLSFGDELSFAHGVNVNQTIRFYIIIVSIFISFSVAICGPIGFIGIIVPHFVRLLGYRRHKIQLIFAYLGGGVFLSISDTLARSIIFPSEVPVGVITALIGSPLFFWLLIRKKQ